MTIFLIAMLIINICAGIMLFITMYKKRKLFDDRYAMIMAACTSGSLSLSVSMLFYSLLPFSLASLSFATVIFGVIIGGCFGGLVKFQSFLSGCFHGMVGSMMGTMLAAVIKDPSLCNLPNAFYQQMNEMIISFGLFVTAITLLTTILVHFSLRV